MTQKNTKPKSLTQTNSLDNIAMQAGGNIIIAGLGLTIRAELL